MTTAAQQNSGSVSFWSWCSTNRHLITAALILAVAAGGWNAAVSWLQWATTKMPVSWPQSVEVDPETFQNVTFPTEIGPYSRAEDGEWSKLGPDGKPTLDGVPDGETVIDETVMEPLGIGGHFDKQRVEQRMSNWYVSRVYLKRRDKQLNPKFQRWRFSVYYYTGKQDMVPHVPDACLAASGATVTGSTIVKFDVPAVPDEWKNLAVRRTDYERESQRYVQYHVFSSNGKPANDRLNVRWQLALPTTKHCFFGKIEFAPVDEVTDIAEADAAAREFLTYFLPPALAALPTSADVERLDAAGKQ